MKQVRPQFTADDLRALPDDQAAQLLKELGPAKVEELKYLWPFWARQNQLEPEGKWRFWLLNAGRGFGKTRTGAGWVRHRIKSGDGRIACVAPTKGDVRRVMVEGESGLLNICWKNDKTYRGANMGFPVWSPTNNTLTWANGAKAEFFSAEDPERLRGPQFYSAWTDEIAAWNNMQETWDMLQFCLRLGKSPKVCITTTPKPVKLIRWLMSHPETVMTTGSSYENAGNIDVTALAAYEGTRLGRQELYAEVLDEAAGALWNRELLAKCEIEEKDLPETFSRVVVSVDPAVTANEESDMTGIVVTGMDVNGNCYVLKDATDRFTPEGWATRAVELYYEYEADRIVAERNQGGEMVRHTIHTVDDTVPVKLVHASKGKMARAEPVSALYERGKVFHVKGLNDLEDQMVAWEPLGSIGSPDRLDALVWSVTDLALKGYVNPEISISYKK